MGDREDPARLVFTSKTGPAIATSLIDLGDRFRLIINDVECKKVEKPMPKLPVGSAFWTPQPNLKTGAEAWILAGGAHHTAFTYDLTAEQMGDWANAMGIEAVYIDKDCISRRISLFRNGNRARIQQCITFLFLCPEHMCVAVDQNIPLLKWRQIVFIIDMSVGSIKSSAIQVKNAVICHYRELEHHLIYFSLTVASYCIDFFLHIIQHGTLKKMPFCVNIKISREVF